VADFFSSPRHITNAWAGPLIRTGIGYLGVRFYAPDGLHYGWIRVRQMSSTIGAPIIVDRAYETRIDTPIRAGFIGSGGSSRQFTVNFQESEGIPGQPVNTGTLILTGDTLRCELTLAGSFSTATIGGPSEVHAHAKPFANLGEPLAARQFASSLFTAFFDDVSLSHSQILQLLRGAIYISVDGGTIVGQISPPR
jgi:hypothetical protein